MPSAVPARIRLLGVVLAAAAVAVSACTTGADAVDQSAGGEFRFVAGTAAGQTIPVADRRTAPGVSAALIGGGRFDLTGSRGKVVVLNFWASWCNPCRVESPQFDQVFQATRPQGVEIVGVDIKDDRQLAEAFVHNKALTYPIVFDPLGRVAVQFRGFPVNALPATIVVDRQGRVAATYVRPVSGDTLLPVVLALARAT